jgi:hypothetical protein
MQIKPVGSSWVMSWNSSWELFFPPNVQESFPQNVSGESSPNPNSETTYMECQERFCHGLIAVHFRAQRRQTRKNSRQKEEEEKIQILPANGKLHQTSSNSSSAVRGWNWIPVANFPRQNPLQIFVTVLLLLYLLLLLLLLLCPVHLAKVSSCLLPQASATAYYSQLKTKTLLRLKKKKTMERRNRILSIRTLP